MFDYEFISKRAQENLFEEHCVGCDALVLLTPGDTMSDICPQCGASNLVCSACSVHCANPCPYEKTKPVADLVNVCVDGVDMTLREFIDLLGYEKAQPWMVRSIINMERLEVNVYADREVERI